MNQPRDREAPDTAATPPTTAADADSAPRPESGGHRAPDAVARDVAGGPAGPDNTARSGQGERPDQAAGQETDRQRGTPQDRRSAEVIDRENIAGDKDFELEPPPK